LRIFALKNFRRFQRKEGIRDGALIRAIRDAGRGLIDADLGNGLIKQRVARRGQGKSRGFRTVIAYRAGHRAVFLYGFAKSDQDNIRDDQLEALRIIGADLLRAGPEHIEMMIADGRLMEVQHAEDQDE
jgi:hypothetical protein